MDFARVHRYAVRRLALAEAELALREGLYLQAETLAIGAYSLCDDVASEQAWALFNRR